MESSRGISPGASSQSQLSHAQVDSATEPSMRQTRDASHDISHAQESGPPAPEAQANTVGHGEVLMAQPGKRAAEAAPSSLPPSRPRLRRVTHDSGGRASALRLPLNQHIPLTFNVLQTYPTVDGATLDLAWLSTEL